MRKILSSIVILLLLTGSLYAGGKKYIAPAEAAVVPIPEIIDPWPIYVGVGLIALGLDRDPCLCGEAETKDLRYGGMIRAGWDFNNYIGIEARALKTFENNVFSETEHYGLYLKPQYHIASQTNVYALLGYGRTIVDYTNGVRSSRTDEKGFSYGVGFEYDFGTDESEGSYSRVFDGQGDQEKGWGMWVDFQHLLSNAGPVHTDSNLVTAGITYDF
jgi:OOP family OmpA-OmpF porin